MSVGVVDGRYYQVAQPGTLAEWMVTAARDQIYHAFVRSTGCDEHSRVIDVGTSDVVSAAANVLERKYPHPSRITAVGLGAGFQFQAEFPAVTYRQVSANQPLPFADGAFDIAASNAVLEHVGSVTEQVSFVDELARVAHRVFISVPNRLFPVEHHTGVPILHWTNPTFRLACCLLGKQEWTEPTNLIMMSRHKLLEACAGPLARGRSVTIGVTGIPLGPFSSNLYALIE